MSGMRKLYTISFLTRGTPSAKNITANRATPPNAPVVTPLGQSRVREGCAEKV
ncbi:hypothetical protein H072_6429 [Dactylellina haptotyla CBS 200.50]|uniref:Uncharacterized protein n=1 Tax=Dactylellina haptotyla (strain CBS 200.50) TaxID=1284197 RepID=S8BWR9_DACHA|nr:hypothetical protein H072_6429 [Dactylellina haptotyla CBS 200.50]